MNAPGQRSGIPKVMGILMIIFGGIGLIGSLIGLAGSSGTGDMGDAIPALKTWGTISMLFGVIGLGISGLHVFAGIRAVGYKANAPKLAMTYGMVNIASNLIQLIMIFAWIKPAISKAAGDFPGAAAAGSVVGGFALIMTIVAVIWPTLVLILMSRPGAKQACTN